MEDTRLYKIIFVIALLALWWYGSEWLKANPNLTIYFIPLSYGMLTVVTIVIQLVLRKDIQARIKELLNLEIEERKEGLLEELKELVSYLEKTKIPNYSESGVEGLEEDFREFDSIRSKYTFQPKIIKSTLLLVLSSVVLILFWSNPTLWVGKAEGYPDITLAHVGLGLLAIALWMILSILITSLEVRIWERE